MIPCIGGVFRHGELGAGEVFDELMVLFKGKVVVFRY
jgi:hypothetical protein